MDRLSHLRGEAGGSRDSTLDTTSPPSESFMTANESSSKYFSLSEVDMSNVDSTFDISSIKDVSLASTTTDSEGTMTNTDELISNLSPIGNKSDMLDSYKIGTQIEAANILSGGVDIFEDNDNSYDGDELVIDDNVDLDDKSNSELKQSENMQFKSDENMMESTLINEENDIASKDTEVVLQIDGKNVDAIDIGNGLYLYRKEGQEELAAVQIIDDDQQQTSFKFLKVRENAEGNLEVYEEIEIEVPKEVPAKEVKMADKKISSHVPIKDINKVISESACNKVAERKNKTPRKEPISIKAEDEYEIHKETSPDGKSEFNFNGKMMKFSESRKSPVVGSFTPMTYHSTPNKEGIPLTKTMVDQQLHPNRHSDNVKKTIEVHTDSCKQRPTETLTKNAAADADTSKNNEITEKGILLAESYEKDNVKEEKSNQETINIISIENVEAKQVNDKFPVKGVLNVPSEQDSAIDSTENNLNKEKAVINNDIEIVNKENMKEDSEGIANIKENLKDMGILATLTPDKNESTMEELLQVGSENLASLNENRENNNDDVMVSGHVQFKNESGMETDLSDGINKALVQDNTHSDSQDKTKAEEIIYNISTDQENIEEIIIIDDSEIEDNKIGELISVNNKQDTKHKNIQSNNVETDISTNNDENQKLQEQGVHDSNKIDAENVQADSTSSVISDIHKEQLKENKVLFEIVKNNKSKIPILKQEIEKVTTKQTSSECSATIEPFKPFNTKREKSDFITEPLEEKPKSINKPFKNPVLDTIPPISYKTPEESQKLLVNPHKIQDEIKVVPEIQEHKKPIQIFVNTDKPNSGHLKEENHVRQLSPQKDSKISFEVTESRPIATSIEVDSSTDVKVKNDSTDVVTGKVPSNSLGEQKPICLETPANPFLKPRAVVEKQEEKVQAKDLIPDKANSDKNVDVSTGPKEEEPQPGGSGTQDVSSTSAESLLAKNNETEDSRDESEGDETRPGKSKKAVPFGKWTATNRKEFLDKIKHMNTAPPATPSTSNQLKNSNDLNRRDVLQKIDSQRQTSSALAKTQEANKLSNKNETAFLSKVTMNKDNNNQDSKNNVKTDAFEETSEAASNKEIIKVDGTINTQNELSQTATVSAKKENAQRTEVNYQDLIDKTIEGMIHRTVVPPKAIQEEPNQNVAKDKSNAQNVKYPPNYQPTDQATLDAIEMKMNELHGIPFIERPPHELPVVPTTDTVPFSKAEKEKLLVPKTTKIPNLLPFTNKTQQKIIKENVIEVDSEEEVIEHEPITGDINIDQKNISCKVPSSEKPLSYTNIDKSNVDASKKESIITEKDFEKFARRNSITYENCLTVSFDGKEPHNVIQTVVEKDPHPKSYSRIDNTQADAKAKIPYKYQNVCQSTQPAKIQALNKFGPTNEDSSNRNQSKLQKAYQSALTAKRRMECPITIIEDKPVKVVFMDNMEYIPSQLNVQGQELSPIKKLITEPDNLTISTLDSLDSEALDTTDDSKFQEEVKTKTKHQRKQVLTPVDEPELELIEPKDLGLEVSPKKKRKPDEDKTDKNAKYPMRKKYYLLASNAVTEEKFTHTTDVMKNPLKETVNRNDNGVSHKNTVSAIDNLVKAAELLEHQSENMNIIDSPNPDRQQSTPVKRGRGRPRKYPLPEGGNEKNKVSSPQKKPRLIDAKAAKCDTTTDDDSDDEIIRENWTMGKINENIVCPICNKLFRTENVVFKHVKHCTGPSPSRSGSDKRSPRRMRPSQESDSKSIESRSDDMDMDDDKPLVIRRETLKKRKSKDSIDQFDDKHEVIVIEDTPVKENSENKEKEVDDRKHHEPRKPRAKMLNKNNDLVCEFCGKTFRQLSYLVSHKLQHKKDEPKKLERDAPVANKTVYSCEVCKKEFRKLHHLVQHRIIHNTSSMPARSLRKGSSEHSDNVEKEPATSRQSEDQSAGFRCEPCDKSFRKLHHLVEHRETHDGINRQKTTPVIQTDVEKEKPISLHQCEVCKKTFRKLHHLIEHKEQHIETSSEKSDDKSVKSSLSTRDIIHECSLCYMVFPNEHSLNKHTIICQRKKRQSKQAKLIEESETVESIEDASDSSKVEEKLDDLETAKLLVEEIKDEKIAKHENKPAELPIDNPEITVENPVKIVKEIEKENVPQKLEIKPVEPTVIPAKKDFVETENAKTEAKSVEPEKIKKVEVKENIKVHETSKKNTPFKGKSMASASKRHKTMATVHVPINVQPTVESCDDDEVRYMLNPNFKIEDTAEEKVFMKVRANKRSSLQIERPNSKDLVKRRTSLQHPPKIPRLKPKAVEPSTVAVKHVAKVPKLEPVYSTDSDDSETVKYSFPKTIPEKSTKPAQERTLKEVERKNQKKSLADKRKSLSGIAKRKSLGKAVTARHKPSPMKQTKRRTMEVEHRCDCGQLFSSAALLSRHTTLAHTPPRIRRRRSPPPEEKPVIKPAPRKSSIAEKHKQTPASRKSSARSDGSTSSIAKPNKSESKTRKTLDKETKTPVDARKPKTEKCETKSSVKTRRPAAHRGVPVPEKMRKLMQKNNK